MKALSFDKKQEKEVKSNILFSTSYKTIIVLDGHGLSKTQNIDLTNSYYYLAGENSTIINNFEIGDRKCALKFIYTNFLPESKNRLVQIR